MTPEQQRVAIAEACGLTNVAPMIVKNVKHEGDDITVGIWSDDGWVPQYLNDLNAMHDAEMVVGACWPTYCEHLLEIVEPEPRTLEICHRWNLLHATATQRAEAFLRTIGKWEEAK